MKFWTTMDFWEKRNYTKENNNAKFDSPIKKLGKNFVRGPEAENLSDWGRDESLTCVQYWQREMRMPRALRKAKNLIHARHESIEERRTWREKVWESWKRVKGGKAHNVDDDGWKKKKENRKGKKGKKETHLRFASPLVVSWIWFRISLLFSSFFSLRASPRWENLLHIYPQLLLTAKSLSATCPLSLYFPLI